MNTILKIINYYVLFFLFITVIPTEKPVIDYIFPNPPKSEKTIEVHGKKAIFRKDIFEWITGMEEEDFIQELKRTKKTPFSEKTVALIKTMHHENPTVKELKESVQNKLIHQDGKFSILHVDVVQYPHLRDIVDIGALQARYPNAVFQTASRANGLESAQKVYQPNKDDFSAQNNGFNSALGIGAVQGEEAQVSCALKGIYEIYGTDKNINFFDELGLSITSTGNLEQLNPEQISSLETSDIPSLAQKIRVGHWQNILVSTGYANALYQSKSIKKKVRFNLEVRENNNDDANIIAPSGCFVSQVNVAAIDMDPNRSSFKAFGNRQDLAEKCARAALQASYEGTIYSALKENKPKVKVFLTLVGAGSFKNKLEWIAEVLENLAPTIKQSGLDVTLAAVGIDGNLLKQEDIWEKIKAVAIQTGGTIREYTKRAGHSEATIRSKPPITSQSPQNITNYWSTSKFLLHMRNAFTALRNYFYPIKYD